MRPDGGGADARVLANPPFGGGAGGCEVGGAAGPAFIVRIDGGGGGADETRGAGGATGRADGVRPDEGTGGGVLVRARPD